MTPRPHWTVRLVAALMFLFAVAYLTGVSLNYFGVTGS